MSALEEFTQPTAMQSNLKRFLWVGNWKSRLKLIETVCALTSNAPIFPVTPEHDLPMWIVTELEILLAQQRAHWDPQHPHAFETHLSTVDPFTLYASCLQALQAKSAQPGMGITSDHYGYHFVDKEITWLQKMESGLFSFHRWTNFSICKRSAQSMN